MSTDTNTAKPERIVSVLFQINDGISIEHKNIRLLDVSKVLIFNGERRSIPIEKSQIDYVIIENAKYAVKSVEKTDGACTVHRSKF